MRWSARSMLVVVGLYCLPLSAYGADAATVIFDSGQTIRVDDGFRQIAEAMKTGKPEVLELAVGNATVLLNIREVVVLCRDQCRGVGIKHQLDPKSQN